MVSSLADYRAIIPIAASWSSSLKTQKASQVAHLSVYKQERLQRLFVAPQAGSNQRPKLLRIFPGARMQLSILPCFMPKCGVLSIVAVRPGSSQQSGSYLASAVRVTVHGWEQDELFSMLSQPDSEFLQHPGARANVPKICTNVVLFASAANASATGACSGEPSISR